MPETAKPMTAAAIIVVGAVAEREPWKRKRMLSEMNASTTAVMIDTAAQNGS